MSAPRRRGEGLLKDTTLRPPIILLPGIMKHIKALAHSPSLASVLSMSQLSTVGCTDMVGLPARRAMQEALGAEMGFTGMKARAGAARTARHKDVLMAVGSESRQKGHRA